MKTGTKLIAEERQRQILQEGWTPEHDDHHASGELNDAAIGYAQAAALQARGETFEMLHVAVSAGMIRWPWEDAWWKPAADPIRNLVKAGALIAAEIDRLQRMSNKKGKGCAMNTCHDQGECLRPTPETDAEELHEPYLVNELPFCVVRIDFARRLERERNEARELLASEKSTRNVIIAKGIEAERQLAEAREENARLREALEKINAIKNRDNGGDWDEIEEARDIAQHALTP